MSDTQTLIPHDLPVFTDLEIEDHFGPPNWPNFDYRAWQHRSGKTGIDYMMDIEWYPGENFNDDYVKCLAVAEAFKERFEDAEVFNEESIPTLHLVIDYREKARWVKAVIIHINQ